MKYFKNLTENSADFYVYGEIVDEKTPDWWTGEVSATAVDTLQMRDELDELSESGVNNLNIYLNSPGGDVFASSTMVSLLKRFKRNANAKINAYIDGLCASAATYLAMVADEINVYQNSILMIHKPMTVSIGNANDLQKDIYTLNTIENDVMLPMYLNKSKVDAETIKSCVNNETWFTGNSQDELFIGNYFDINYLDEEKNVAACASTRLFKNYKNIPGALKKVEPKKVEKPIDYSAYETVICKLKEGK